MFLTIYFQVQVTERGPYRSKYDPLSLSDAFSAVVTKKLPVQNATTIYGVPITTSKDRGRGRISVDVVKVKSGRHLYSHKSKKLYLQVI